MSRHAPLFRRRSFATATSGTAAVEFAILLPFYLFFLLGMLAYGIYFGAAHSVQQLAADAARTAIAGAAGAGAAFRRSQRRRLSLHRPKQARRRHRRFDR
jgi:Flp pilus assembly protein TadG